MALYGIIYHTRYVYIYMSMYIYIWPGLGVKNATKPADKSVDPTHGRSTSLDKCLVGGTRHSGWTSRVQPEEGAARRDATFQGTIGCTPNSVPMVFIVFSRDYWGS